MVYRRDMGQSGDELESRWLRERYRGDGVPQLTARAIATGAVIGALLCLSNLYVQLKLGVALGVAITACIIAHAGSRGWARLSRGRFSPLGLLETNTAQSIASSAGYATGGTMASAIAAYLLVTGRQMSFGWLLGWTFLLAALGVCFAVPFKRRMINVEELPFPSGTAAAETLQSLYARGADASVRARVLASTGAIGGLVALWRDAGAGLGLALPRLITSRPMIGDLAFGVDVSVLLLGAGALIGLRTTVSMAAGAIGCFGVLAPWARAHGGISGSGVEATLGWSLWTGSAILASSSLVTLLLDGGALLAALRGLGLGRRRTADPLAGVEVPARWFWIGAIGLGLAVALVARLAFAIPVAFGLVAVALSFVLAGVACRVTGETDATPTGALGQITQLTYGALMPQNLVANLMTASITGNSAAAAADLLSDLKSGWLVGANPRRQFLAQLLGCVVGAAVIVPVYLLLVPDAAALGGARFAAPAAFVLAGVAKLLAQGVGALHPTIELAMGAGALVGAALAVAERALPASIARRLPSAAGLGLAFLLPASTSFALLTGAALSAVYLRGRDARAGGTVATVASGLIAGESVAGVLIALLAVTGVIAAQ